MNVDIHIRPAVATAPMPIMRPVPDAADKAVRTELPSEKAVAASDAIEPANLTPRRTPVQTPAISKAVMIDRDAASVVFVSIDDKTKQVVNQYPEESRLRTRAYLRSLDTAKLEAQLTLGTDRQA